MAGGIAEETKSSLTPILFFATWKHFFISKVLLNPFGVEIGTVASWTLQGSRHDRVSLSVVKAGEKSRWLPSLLVDPVIKAVANCLEIALNLARVTGPKTASNGIKCAIVPFRALGEKKSFSFLFLLVPALGESRLF